MLTKEQILSADDLPVETVEVPEWGGEVTVLTMTGSERDAWELMQAKRDKQEAPNVRATLCAMTICDAERNLLFNIEDVEALGKKSASALERVFRVAMKLNYIGESDVKELEKN